MTTNGGVQEEKVNTDIVTLTRFLTEEQVKHREATGDFTYVVCTIPRPVGGADKLPDFFAMPSNFPSNRLPTTSEELPSSTLQASQAQATPQAMTRKNSMLSAMTSS